VVERLRKFDRVDPRFGRRSMWCGHRKQHRAQVRDGIGQNDGICVKMLSLRMRRISPDARMIDSEAVESASRNAGEDRQNRQQH